MIKNDQVQPFTKKKNDLLDQIIEINNVDEMGLLDLLFVEEILNQKKQDIAG